MIKLTKENMEINRDDMVDFARQSENEFYRAALEAYDIAEEVFQMAKAERDAAFNKLAMQIKLCDSEEYMKIGIDWHSMDEMSGGEKLKYLMSKGKYRLGQTALVERDFSYNR